MDNFELLLNKDVIAFKMVHDNMEPSTHQEKLLKKRINELINDINEFIQFSRKNKNEIENDPDPKSKAPYYAELKEKEEEMANKMMENMDKIINSMHVFVDESIMTNFELLFENPDVDTNLLYEYDQL